MAVHSVRSDVAGKVWKVVAKAGDRVAAEDTLVILESMKMEIPVAARVRRGPVGHRRGRSDDRHGQHPPEGALPVRGHHLPAWGVRQARH